MNQQEQAAFVEAYSNHVADVPSDRVAEFVSRYASGCDMDYSSDYTPIMDALGMWNDAIKWTLSKQMEAV